MTNEIRSSENNQKDETDKVDRGIPSLKTDKKKTNISKLFIWGGLTVGAIAIAGGGVLFVRELEVQKQAQREAAAKLPQQQPVEIQSDFTETKKRIKEEEAQSLPPPASVLASSHQSMDATVQAAPIPETPEQRRLSGNVLVNLRAENAQESPAQEKPLADNLDDKLRPSKLTSGMASQRQNLTMLLRRGTMIPCVQKTSINTTYPGMVSCQISKDVYSANGNTLLIERGSEVIGEQRSALTQGQAKIFVIWTRIETPSGVVADINSPGTDTLGATGIDAYVDTHFLQRFGGAIMLSLIGDFSQAFSQRASSESPNRINLSNTASAGQELAAKTLESTINIPPTAYSNHGSAISIFVARDIDFGDVYELTQH